MTRMFAIAVLILACMGVHAAAESNTVYVIGTNSPDFRPKNQEWYGLTLQTTYRNTDSNNPGPPGLKESEAWDLANEFVYRTALRRIYRLPASSLSPCSLIDAQTEAESHLYVVCFKHQSSERQLVLLVNAKKRQIGVMAR